eukprot:TRINITY_DN1487_c0_g1_i3.p1 TRINITY_DN1487_c0_g1~~TRINITY_DN1487_c0_g1_i3.p1  ORF type:complete len:187 (-),score=31.80 TRINITY_DN1487_c0_g1_i3:676-1176(-)
MSVPSCRVLWQKRIPGLSVLLLGQLYEEEEPVLILGTISGNLRLLRREDGKEVGLLETKGGAIQAIVLHKITHFRGQEVVGGDADGNVFIFSNNQILSRHSFGSPISHLVVHLDAVNNWSVVAGDQSGTLTCFCSYRSGGEHDYKIRIYEKSHTRVAETISKELKR